MLYEQPMASLILTRDLVEIEPLECWSHGSNPSMLVRVCVTCNMCINNCNKKKDATKLILTIPELIATSNRTHNSSNPPK